MVLSRRRQWDRHEAEPLQYLRVVSTEIYRDNVDAIQDEVKDGFKASVEMRFINDNGERIQVPP